MNLIKGIRTTENWELIISLENGEARIFDAKPYLQFEAFLELNEMPEFQKISNGKYFVEWESGADLSLDTLMAHSKIIEDVLLVA
jgi:hypothetical protein